MFVDVIVIVHAPPAAEERGERRGALGRALQLHEADEHALGLGGGQVIDQAALPPQAQATPEEQQADHRTNHRSINDCRIHAPMFCPATALLPSLC